MNNRIKRLQRDLEGLGFEYDHDASSPRRGTAAYRHANEPETVLRISMHMSDSGCTAVWKKAQQIAGLSTSGGTKPSTIKERARVTRERERAQEDRFARVREQHAQRLEEARRRRDASAASADRERDIQSLMQPGYGR